VSSPGSLAAAPFRAALALATALAVSAPSGPSRGDEPAAPRPKLVLDPLDAKEVQRSLASAVEGRVCQALGEASPGVDLVCPEDVAAAMTIARQEALMGRCATEECMRRVEEMKAGPRRVTGAIRPDGKGLLVRLDLRDGMKEPRSVEAHLPGDLDALFAGLPGLVQRLLAAR